MPDAALLQVTDLVKNFPPWEGVPYALDVSHPAVLEWLDKLIEK